jgi:hypothetical protein
MKSNEKGFSVVGYLLVVIIIIVLGFIGYYVWGQGKQDKLMGNNSDASESSPTVTSTANTSEPVINRSYRVEFDKFSFQYPAGWTVNDNDANRVLLLGPNGFRVLFMNADGLGGACVEECPSSNIPNQTLATLNYYTKPLYVVLNGIKDKSIYGDMVTVFNVIPEQSCYYNICYGYQGKFDLNHETIIRGSFIDMNGNSTYVEPSKFVSSPEVKAALKILGTIKY